MDDQATVERDDGGVVASGEVATGPSGEPGGAGDEPTIEARLQETIEAIRPAVQADGGDLYFHGIDDRGVVTVELVGACVSCPASTLTLKAGVERILKDRVPGVTSVISLGENDETVVSL